MGYTAPVCLTVEDSMTSTTPPDTGQLMTITALADYLAVPVETIRTWRKRVPADGPRAIRVGRHLRWPPADVHIWLEQNREEAA